MGWELFQEYVSAHLKSDTYTILPARVEATHDFESKQYVNVVPLVNRLWDDERDVDDIIVYNVPVVFSAGGGAGQTFPIKKGNGVLLFACMRDIDDWRDGDGVTPSKAKTSRSHSITDGIAIAGLFNENTTTNPHPEDTEWFFTNSKIVQKPDGTIESTNNNSAVTQKPDGEVVINNPAGDLTYKVSGELLHPSGAKITADGDFVTASGISLNQHVHDVIVTKGSSADTYTSEVAS